MTPTRRNTSLRKRYKFNNEIIVEVSWHHAWECDFIEVFYPPRQLGQHYARQKETRRQLFQKIRTDIAIMINPDVAKVIDRFTNTGGQRGHSGNIFLQTGNVINEQT